MEKLKTQDELKELSTEELEAYIQVAGELRRRAVTHHRMAAHVLEARRSEDRAAAAVAAMNDTDREALRTALAQTVKPKGIQSKETVHESGQVK